MKKENQMNSNKLWLPAFILMVLAQLYVPASMIFDQEDILNTGTDFKFKAAPIDPLDPFRGKYITLRFDETTVEISDEDDWKQGETIYVFLENDTAGFAKIKSVSKDRPANDQSFLQAEVAYLGWSRQGNPKSLTINYPFDRFYMEESKAPDAELVYREAQIDSAQVVYALVSIKDGQSVLKDVLIDDVPIKEVVKQHRLEQEKPE